MELVPYPTLADSICDTCSPKKRTDLFYLLIVRSISSYEFSRQHTERAYDENIFSLEVYPFFFCS